MTALLALLLACGSPEPAEPPAAAEPPPAEPAAEPPPAPSARLDLNTAGEEALGAIPGMSPRMVHEFEEYRPYVSIAQWRKEMAKYVDADTIAGWEPYIYVPVDPDHCDAATLAQLPGVDAATAEALLAKRPFPDRAVFLAALEEAVGPADAKAGQALLAK